MKKISVITLFVLLIAGSLVFMNLVDKNSGQVQAQSVIQDEVGASANVDVETAQDSTQTDNQESGNFIQDNSGTLTVGAIIIILMILIAII